jgi:hypothetical protein
MGRRPVKVGGLGVDNTDYYIEDNIGYYELGTGDIQTFQQFLVGGGVYATNSLSINVKTNGVQGSNGDTGTIITFTVLLDDVVVSGDPVDGDTTVTATVNFPSAVYLTESPWKTVTTGSGNVAVSMSTEKLQKLAESKFDIKQAKLNLLERVESQITFTLEGGLFKATPALLAEIVSLRAAYDPEDSVVILDEYNNPILVCLDTIQVLALEARQYALNSYRKEYEILKKVRKGDKL